MEPDKRELITVSSRSSQAGLLTDKRKIIMECYNQVDNPQVNHFSPTERQDVLNKILSSLRKDPRVTGVLIVGSGSVGFEDVYSDIDLCVVITKTEDVKPTFLAWGDKLRQMLPVFYCGQSVRGPNSFLWVLLLEFFLEVDVGFLCLDDLEARKERWLTDFDRSGKIEETMQRSWDARVKSNLEDVYDQRVNWLWHKVIHGTVAAQRGQMWRALSELEQIRNQTIELRGIREGLETKRFRNVDQLPHEFLFNMEKTLATNLSKPEIMRAIWYSTECFFLEAKNWDELLNRDLAAKFEKKLKDYLTLFV